MYSLTESSEQSFSSHLNDGRSGAPSISKYSSAASMSAPTSCRAYSMALQWNSSSRDLSMRASLPGWSSPAWFLSQAISRSLPMGLRAYATLRILSPSPSQYLSSM